MRKLRLILEQLDRIVAEHPDWVALAALAISCALCLREAATTYLNPDELYYLEMSMQPALGAPHQGALDTHHPPLNVAILHWLHMISDREWVLRSVSIAAGAIYPWFLYRWLGLVWNRLAGLIALVVVAFAPHLVSLGAQARTYTLAYLAICACLYCQERALRESSWRWMAALSGALWAGIISEYFVAFFAAGAGLSFLARAWRERPGMSICFVWAAGQVVGMGLYGLLFLTHIQPMLSTSMGRAEEEAWLHGTFPWPGDSLPTFVAMGILKQFAWLFASIPLGVWMAVPFLVGVWMLWKGPFPQGALPGRLAIVLTATMFLLAAGASIAHFHPFGRSRHTGFLGIFIAAIVAVAMERALRRRPGLLVVGAMVVVPAWRMVATEDWNNIPRARHGREKILSAIEGIRTRVPRGTAILMDRETRRTVEYYLRQMSRKEMREGPEEYKLVAYRFGFESTDQLVEDMWLFRHEGNALPDGSLWVAEGGWDLFSFRGEEAERVLRRDMQDFGGAMWLIRVPPGFGRARE